MLIWLYSTVPGFVTFFHYVLVVQIRFALKKLIFNVPTLETHRIILF